MSCPICGVPYGFHDDEPHQARQVPMHLLIETEAQEDLCNCGFPYDSSGAPKCKHPRHTNSTNEKETK